MKSKIIVELGSNHMNSIDIGKDLLDTCKVLGCTMVKMQLWKADDLYKDTPIYEQTKKLELGYDLAKYFFDYAKSIGVDLFFSVFNQEAVDFCEKIGVKYYKIAARSTNDYDLVKKIARTNKKTFVSFSKKHNNINFDIHIIERIFSECSTLLNMIPLYSISEYPPKPEEFDILMLQDIIDDNNGGYSNHYLSIYPCIIASSLGASYIEIHVMSKLFPESPDKVCSWDFEKLDKFIKIMKEWNLC